MSLGLGIGLQYPRGLIGGGGFDPDYEAILAQGTPPSASIQTAQNDLLVAIKAISPSDGVWTKIRSLQIWRDGVTGGDDFKSIDWKRPEVKATLISGVVSSTTGFQGNGTSAYVNLNYNANDDNPLLEENLTVGYWSVNGTDAGINAQIGALGASGIQISPRDSSRMLVAANSVPSQFTDTGLGANEDIELITLTNNAGTVTARKNSTTLGTAILSSGFYDGNVYALSRNLNEVATGFSADTLSMTFISEALTLAEITGLKTAFDNYIASL